MNIFMKFEIIRGFGTYPITSLFVDYKISPGAVVPASQSPHGLKHDLQTVKARLDGKPFQKLLVSKLSGNSTICFVSLPGMSRRAFLLVRNKVGNKMRNSQFILVCKFISMDIDI